MLVIFRGLPGSGKSTAAHNCGFLEVVEADQFFMIGNDYEFNPALIGYAHEWARGEMVRALLTGKDVGLANTFSQKWEIASYLEAFKALGGGDAVVVKCTGDWGSTHGVPPSSIMKMKERWEDIEGEISLETFQEMVLGGTLWPDDPGDE